jgi:hypothetical protein
MAMATRPRGSQESRQKAVRTPSPTQTVEMQRYRGSRRRSPDQWGPASEEQEESNVAPSRERQTHLGQDSSEEVWRRWRSLTRRLRL